jgi:PBP1b-binding outer membrane lipoprotein LpoB
MKKIFAIALIVSAFALASCGNNESTETTSVDTTAVDTTVVDSTAVVPTADTTVSK